MADLLAKVATYKDIRTTVFVHLMFTEEIGVDNWHGVRVGACTRCSTRVSTITLSYIYIYIYISRKLIIIRFFFIPSKEKKKRFENGIEYFEWKNRKQWRRYVLLSWAAGNRRSRVEEKNLNLLNYLLECDELQDRLPMEVKESLSTDESMKNIYI